VIEAVLYDLDGLIVDSEALHGKASEEALNKYGHGLAELPAVVRKNFYGKRVIETAGEVIGWFGLPVTPEQWAGERLEIFLRLIEDGISLMPGVEQSLKFFDGKGMKKAVVSSGDRRYVERMLEITGMAEAFQAVVTGDDVTLGKPDPLCFLIGARALDTAPGNSLVLEDAYAGICAARAAGMKVVGIRNKYNDNFDGADLVLESLAEIDESVLNSLTNYAKPARK